MKIGIRFIIIPVIFVGKHECMIHDLGALRASRTLKYLECCILLLHGTTDEQAHTGIMVKVMIH